MDREQEIKKAVKEAAGVGRLHGQSMAMDTWQDAMGSVESYPARQQRADQILEATIRNKEMPAKILSWMEDEFNWLPEPIMNVMQSYVGTVIATETQALENLAKTEKGFQIVKPHA